MSIKINNHNVRIYDDSELVMYLSTRVLEATGNRIFFRKADLERMLALLNRDNAAYGKTLEIKQAEGETKAHLVISTHKGTYIEERRVFDSAVDLQAFMEEAIPEYFNFSQDS